MTVAPREHRRAQTLIESITDPLCHLDGEWRFAFVNEAALAYFGVRRGDLLGRVVWEAMPQVTASEIGEQLRGAVREGRSAAFETLSPMTGKFVEVRAYPSSEGLTVSFKDVTARHHAEERDRLLLELDDAARTLSEPEAIAGVAVRLLRARLDADRCLYADVPAGGDALEVLADTGGGDTRRILPLAAFGTAFEDACRAGQPFVSDDLESDPRVATARAMYREADIRAIVSLCHLQPGPAAGGIAVCHQTPRRWSPHQIQLASLVARRCREFIERARLTRTLLRKTLAFSVLADNGTRLLAEERPQAVMHSLFEQASELAGVELGLHHLVTPDGTSLQLAASYGLPEGPPAGLMKAAVGERAAAATARPVVKCATDERGDSEWTMLRAMGVRAYACFPLAFHGTLLGTLSFGIRRRAAFDHDEILFLQTLSGQVAAAVGRARGARDLRESEERLLQAAAIAGLGTFDTDLGSAEMAVNEPGRAIYGWPPDAALTFAAAQAHFHPADRARVVAVVRKAFDRTGDAFDVEHRIIRTDGAVRWIRVRGRALFDQIGGDVRATRCLGTFVDITDRKEADERRDRTLRAERAGREEAERLGRLKDEFLATVSHELRTPLNAILGWSQVLRRRPMSPEDTRNAIEVIDRNARAQAQLIDDLLDMSRFITGNIRLEMGEVDLALVVTTAVESVQPVADAKGVQLQLRLPSGEAMVSGDATRLQQVVWNLLSNAVKFTPAGGRVDAGIEWTESGVDITIRDTGEGIDPGFLPHIFEPFRQQDSSPTRRHGGVGLGLSIVKQLVEVHGGDVRATSAGPGAGSTFVVSLPAAAPSPASAGRGVASEGLAASEPSDWPGRGLDGIRVLVVEDEPDALALLVRILGETGAEVSASGSADSALEHLAGGTVDVLVSDIGMPGVDGYALIRRVRALPDAALSGVPAIAVSAYAREADGQQAFAAGYQRYVAKPVDVVELIAAIAALARPARGGPGGAGGA